MKTIKTQRLNIRPLNLKDAAFIINLFNTKGFLKYIGDKNIKTLKDAENYLIHGPIKMYEELNIGLCMVERLSDKEKLGISGLIKRDTLDDIDIGFGFLPEFANKGYAIESTQAVFDQAKEDNEIKKLVAITNSNNEKSIKLIEKLGMRFEKNIEKLTDNVDLRLYSIKF